MSMSQMFGSGFNIQNMNQNTSMSGSMNMARSMSSNDVYAFAMSRVMPTNSTEESKDAFDFVSRCLPDFVPIRKNESAILDAAAIKLLSVHMPPHVRMREWSLLFTISQHGFSIITLLELCKGRDNVLIVVEDA